MSAELWAVFPVITYLGIVAWEMSVRPSLVEALLRSAVWWTVGVWVGSNTLGFFSLLHPDVLRGIWSVVGVGIGIVGFYRLARSQGRFAISWPQVRGWQWILIVTGGVLLGLTLVTATFSPAVTVDVLNYHLPRQLMWLQQGSLDHFITVNDRALMMPPLAEVIGLQFLGLTGNDYWVNIPQWIAYALLPLVTGKIARGLGTSKTAALLAGWLVLCLPMAYHEASNAKNDLMGSFWIALLAWRVVEASGNRKVNIGEALLVGIILALALLTKSTAFIYAPPLLVSGFWFWRRVAGSPLACRFSLVATLVCLLLVSPFFLRNLAWYGTPLGAHRAEDGGQQANTAFTPALVTSNAVRNLSKHLAGPWAGWNEGIYRGVAKVHHWMGLSLEDPRNTLWDLEYSVDYRPSAETQTGAPFSVVAIMLAMAVTLVNRRARKWLWLSLILFSMAFFYCLVVKWQPWAPRLQLPIFVLGGVLLVGVAESGSRISSAIAFWVIGLLAFLVWWPGREDRSRPLWTAPTIFSVTRDANQYRYFPSLRERDTQLVELLRMAGVHSVAVVSIHDISYPLMKLMQQKIEGVHFYGAPESDRLRGADAYVRLAFLRPLPLYYTDSRLVRHRLVGRGLGDGIYLPVKKVRELNWMHQLPDFAGWLDSSNIEIGAGVLMPDGSVSKNRFIRSGRGEISFHADEDRMYLSAIYVKTDPSIEGIDILVNGILTKRFDLQRHIGFHHLELALSCHPGVNQVVIKRTDGTEGDLVFTRLLLNDVAPSGGG